MEIRPGHRSVCCDTMSRVLEGCSPQHSWSQAAPFVVLALPGIQLGRFLRPKTSQALLHPAFAS